MYWDTPHIHFLSRKIRYTLVLPEPAGLFRGVAVERLDLPAKIPSGN